ncbi:MAG: toll/interleukin-1 receptor domain-containing protein [Methanophagales archaeon]|nr:toll/interleukin-1 receptor domain-containing protein [Methanophagales archaeon]
MVFLSHSHRDKALALIRAICSYLPKYRSAWIDERASDTADINVLIRDAIQDEADCVIIFLSREAMKPEWVGEKGNGHLKEKKFVQITHNHIHLCF